MRVLAARGSMVARLGRRPVPAADPSAPSAAVPLGLAACAGGPGRGDLLLAHGRLLALRRRTPVRTVIPVGFNNPAMPWKELERRLSNGRAAGSPGLERRRRQPGLDPQAPALRARRRPAGPGVGALRRAALPLQLLLPRRRLPPRGAGRGGGPPGPGGPGPHRPRRVLRRRPLRRGGPGRRPAHRVRRRAHARRQQAAARTACPIPTGHHLVVLADGPEGYARLARAISRASWRGRRARPGSPSTSWPTTGGGHWWVLTGCRKGAVPAALRGRTARPRPARELRPAGRASSAATGSPSSCGTTATRSTRPATTPWPSWPPRRDVACVATNNVHYATPARPPAGHRAGRGAGPAQPRRARPLAAGRRPAPTCARGPSRPAASPATPAWSRRPAEIGPGVRLRPAPWWPPSCRRSPCPDGLDRDGVPAPSWSAEGAARRYGRDGARHQAEAWTDDRPRARPSSRSSASPATSSSCGTSCEFCRRQRHLLPGPGLGGQLARSATPSASPRPTPCRSACCSSASCRPSATARPTSTSTSRRGRREEVIQYVYEPLRPRARRPGGQRHHLPGPLGGARHGQGARLRRRPAGRLVASRSTRWGRVEVTAAPGRPRHPRPRAATWPQQVEDFPRHLGIHSGGMVICDRPVIEVCPVEWARMENRSVLQWDKDDCAAVGLVKFDLLGLGMLTALHDAVDLIRDHRGYEVDLATIPQEDEVYDMLCRADSVGRVPGREPGPDGHAAPAASPATFYDLVVEVALIRPGPIQGGSVHPYIRRRNGQEPVTYLHPLLETQPGARPSASRCSRSSSCRWPSTWPASPPPRPTSCARPWGPSAAAQRMEQLRARLYDGMAERGITGEVADEIFDKMAAFANFGFPESHSVSFAYLVYASAWIKLHEPAAFCAGAAQRPADGLLLAALAGAGRPPPRGRGAHARPQRLGWRSRRSSRAPSSHHERGRARSGSGSVRSIGRGPGRGRSARRAALRRTWRTWCGGCRRSRLAPARGAGHGRGVRLLRACEPAAEALWAVGAVAQTRPGPPGRHGHRGRRAARCRA